MPSEDDPGWMNIVQMNTEDVWGGAALAVYRLYTGLTSLNPHVRMLVRNKKSANPDVIVVRPRDKEIERESESLSGAIHFHYIHTNRSQISTTLFSYPIFGYNFEHSELLNNADVINLHWVTFFCSLSSFSTIIGLKKPVVWTFHDLWPITGGCHYPSGCTRYRNGCMDCPQLEDDHKHLPHFFLQRKLEMIRAMNPVIVTPSRWLADIVKSVDSIRDLRVEVIPNAVDTNLYTHTPKEAARDRLNLPVQGFYLLFSVSNATEKRKGISPLFSALHCCMEDPVFSRKVTTGEIRLICFGNPPPGMNGFHLPHISLGKIESESDLSAVYSAADVFLVPSIEDNLPNIVLESMSCGTPVIAFNIGGIPDMIQNGINGYIVDQCSAEDFAHAILEAAKDPGRMRPMSENCRSIALNRFSLHVQAERYLELYRELVERDGKKTNIQFSILNQGENEVLPDASDIHTYPLISEALTTISSPHQVHTAEDAHHGSKVRDSRSGEIMKLTKSLKKPDRVLKYCLMKMRDHLKF